jgi:hypothetical protein
LSEGSYQSSGIKTSTRGSESIMDNDKITDECDVVGRLFYRHHTSNVGGDASLYLNEAYREAMVSETKVLYEANSKKNRETVLNSLVDMEILTRDGATKINEFYGLVDHMAEDITPEEAWSLVRDFERTLIDDNGKATIDYKPVLIISSLLRNKIAYAYSIGDITQERGGNCFLGRKISCWLKAIGNASLAGLQAAAKFITPFLIEGGGTTSKEVWDLAKSIAYIAGGIGAVIEITEIFLREECKCDSPDPTPVNPCAFPNAIGLSSISDCGGIQTAVVSGQGTAASTYTWSVSGGIAVDYPGAVTAILTAVPTLRIKQTSTTVPVTVTCNVGYSTFGCSPFTLAAPLNIPQLITNPGEVVIVGSVLATHGDPVPYRYLFNGSYRTAYNNNIISNSGASYHGTVTSPIGVGLPYVDVVWNIATTPFSTASVNGTSKNMCSNATFSAWLSPIIIQ